MPAVSKAQRRFMAMCEHGTHTAGKCPNMTDEQMHDFAVTKERGLPARVTKKQQGDLRNGYRGR